MSFRDSYAASLRKKGAGGSFGQRKGAMGRKPIRKVSVKRAGEMALYHAEKREWLALPENVACGICRCLGVHPNRASEVHHFAGRIGRLLRYQPFWIPSCRLHRETPHQRPAWARSVGLLCEPALWNVFPRAGGR